MEYVLHFIERARRWPEPLRRQLLWATVVASCLVIGVAWIVGLQWQLRAPAPAAASQVSVGDQVRQLPGIFENLRNDVGSVGNSIHSGLEKILLSQQQNGGGQGSPSSNETTGSGDAQRNSLPNAQSQNSPY